MGNQILAFVNQKGGVGKTTSCMNFAAVLAHWGKRVLLCDLDPQGNATMGSGVDKATFGDAMTDLLQKKRSVLEAIFFKTPAGYDLIPANRDLTEAEIRLVKTKGAPLVLSEALEPLRDRYDYVFLDCPPSLNMLTLNALVASDAVFIPLSCEYYALEGLTDLLSTIRQLQETLNPRLQIAGILRTLFDPRNRLTTDVSTQLFQHFGKKVFQTVIPRNVRLAEAPSFGLPVILYDPTSRGASAYQAFAKEWLETEAHPLPMEG